MTTATEKPAKPNLTFLPDSYSVGGFTHSGQQFGIETYYESEAEDYFAGCIGRRNVASVALYAWNDDTGECVELATWSR